ncbi:MAG TPA: sugar ABC transporter permease, partial [Lachnospiraceae bacterium]|nr:sugar ABC transporter permease [Lachnospiraceae bacterium]
MKRSEKIKEFFRTSSPAVKTSLVIMGAGHFRYGAPGKGILYLLVEISMIWYLIQRGFKDIAGFFTLGTQEADAWAGIEGDNSIIMLLMGIFAWIVVGVFIYIYVQNLKGAYEMQHRYENGIPQKPLKENLKELLDRKFYMLALALPVIGVCIFNVLPIVFMILIAFTNYGGDTVPPALVDWVGMDNFRKLIVLKKFGPTFAKILGWNLLWAVMSTALNYFAGLGLALLLNKDCVKGKNFWRAFPILAYAIPGFITLLAFKFMFSYGGPINQFNVAHLGFAIGFLDIDAKWSARIIGLLVNCWISVPSIMLLATGILSNRDMS